MNIWIQSHNFDSIEKDNVSIDEAIKIFQEHDWARELSDFEKSIEEKCPPGFGLVSAEGILHICPNKANNNSIFYHYSKKTKLFGIIPLSSDKTYEIESLSNNKAIKLIEFHYSNQRKEILKQK